MPSGTVTPAGGGGGSNAVLQKTRTLTSAEILALFTTPITLVAAPGSGFALVLLQATFVMKPGATPYSNTTLGVGWPAYSRVLAFGSLNVTAPNPTVEIHAPVDDTEITTDIDGAPLIVQAESSNPTAGNGTLDVTVLYSIVDLTP